MKYQLLCTFSSSDSLYQSLDDIRNWYNIVYSSIYVFENSMDSNELFITYNIHKNERPIQLTNTILLHRKKTTNTMYTINALNQIVMRDNNGILDSKFPIEWEKLKNSILIWTGSELRKIETKIHTVFKFN